MHGSPWLMRSPGPAGRIQLFCFPYAGGSASAFMHWQAHLPREVELIGVQLPGRGSRMPEPPFVDIDRLLDELVPAIRTAARSPFAMFGHSLGGTLAFEVALRLRREAATEPSCLFLSACGAPHLRTKRPALHLLDDDALIEALRDYNGTPPDALAHRELMELLLPAIRADFALLASHRPREEAPLALPITALAGIHDPHVSTAQAEGWRECTSEAFSVRHFEGDHFFLQARTQEVVQCVAHLLLRQPEAVR